MIKENSCKSDPDMARSADALNRAALQARREAERTHTPLVTYENGTLKKQLVVREQPSQED